MKHILTLERLGVNLECEKFADILLPIINEYKSKNPKSKLFNFDLNLIPDSFKKDLKYPISSFNIIFSDGNICTMYGNLSNRKLNFKLILGEFFTKRIIIHELHHMFQFSRNVKDDSFVIRNKYFNGLYYSNPNRKSINKKNNNIYLNNIKLFILTIYFSLDDEIDCRIQECYDELVNMGTTKENFKDNLSKTDIFKYPKIIKENLENFIFNISSEKEKYYKWFNYYKNNRIRDFQDIPFGDILDKINMKYINFQVNKTDNKDVEREISIIEKFIKSQSLKYERRLYRLYDLF